jgi:hypothetical protein
MVKHGGLKLSVPRPEKVLDSSAVGLVFSSVTVLFTQRPCLLVSHGALLPG